MQKIERNELAKAAIAGGCCKCCAAPAPAKATTTATVKTAASKPVA